MKNQVRALLCLEFPDGSAMTGGYASANDLVEQMLIDAIADTALTGHDAELVRAVYPDEFETWGDLSFPGTDEGGQPAGGSPGGHPLRPGHRRLRLPPVLRGLRPLGGRPLPQGRR